MRRGSGSPERARGYEEAAQHYRKAVNLTARTEEKIQAVPVRMTVTVNFTTSR
jgi:hypothetical protein